MQVMGIDGVACVGSLEGAYEGLVSSQDEALLAESLKASEQGALCAGAVFEVQRAVRVYRVWNAEKDYTRLGRWWSFERPAVTREQYRQDYAICPSWSALDRLVSCELKVGSKVVVGLTQSAACEDGQVLEKTGAAQLYIPNDTRVDRLYVESCQDEGAWP